MRYIVHKKKIRTKILFPQKEKDTLEQRRRVRRRARLKSRPRVHSIAGGVSLKEDGASRRRLSPSIIGEGRRKPIRTRSLAKVVPLGKGPEPEKKLTGRSLLAGPDHGVSLGHLSARENARLIQGVTRVIRGKQNRVMEQGFSVITGSREMMITTKTRKVKRTLIRHVRLKSFFIYIFVRGGGRPRVGKKSRPFRGAACDLATGKNLDRRRPIGGVVPNLNGVRTAPPRKKRKQP